MMSSRLQSHPSDVIESEAGVGVEIAPKVRMFRLRLTAVDVGLLSDARISLDCLAHGEPPVAFEFVRCTLQSIRMLVFPSYGLNDRTRMLPGSGVA